MSKTINHRIALHSSWAGILLATAGGTAIAQPTCDPGPVPRILSETRELARAPDAEARRTAIANLIAKWAAGDSIARMALHQRWAGLSPAQRDVLVRLLGQLTAARVAVTLSRDGVADYAVLSARPIAGGDCLATTRVVDGRGRPRILHWRMRVGPQGPRFADLLVDGISLTRNLRDEIDAILRDNGGDVSALEKRLRATIARTKGSNR